MADGVTRFLFKGNALNAIKQVDKGIQAATKATVGFTVGLQEVGAAAAAAMAVKFARSVGDGFKAADASYSPASPATPS